MIIHDIDVIAIIGEELTIRLAEELGGTRVMVPLKASDDSVLGRVIGKEAAKNLGQFLGGDSFQMPLCRELLANYYRAQGMSYAQIARKLRITEGGALRLIRRTRKRQQAA